MSRESILSDLELPEMFDFELLLEDLLEWLFVLDEDFEHLSSSFVSFSQECTFLLKLKIISSTFIYFIYFIETWIYLILLFQQKLVYFKRILNLQTIFWHKTHHYHQNTQKHLFNPIKSGLFQARVSLRGSFLPSVNKS